MASNLVVVTKENEKLTGKTFVILGSFMNYERDQVKHKTEANGGKVLSSVSTELSYLLTGDKVSPAKLEKARKSGVPSLTGVNLKPCLWDNMYSEERTNEQ